MPVLSIPNTYSAISTLSRTNLLVDTSLPQTSANNRNNPQNYPSILAACINGDAEWLGEEISKCNAAIHQHYQEEGKTYGSLLICIAAKQRHLEILKLLLQNGADVNAIDEKGNSALLIASGFGHDDIAGFLLDHGANIYITNCNNETSLHIAAYYGHKKIVDRLLDYDIDVNHLSDQESGFTPLYYATNFGYTEIAESLIKYGAIVNIRCGIRGTTPLCIAATQGNLDMVELLLRSGANMNWHSDWLFSPLECACAKGNLEVVLYLLRDMLPDLKDGEHVT